MLRCICNRLFGNQRLYSLGRHRLVFFAWQSLNKTSAFSLVSARVPLWTLVLVRWCWSEDLSLFGLVNTMSLASSTLTFPTWTETFYSFILDMHFNILCENKYIYYGLRNLYEKYERRVCGIYRIEKDYVMWDCLRIFTCTYWTFPDFYLIKWI